MFTVLTEESSREIDSILMDLLEKVEAEAVFFCDRGGNIIGKQSVDPVPNEENIAALASGAFFATLEMARLVGEPEFRYQIHQGEKTGIYMEGTSNDMLLIVVFSKDSNPGLVKLYARNACQQLAQYNIHIGPQMGHAPVIPAIQIELDEDAQPFTRSERMGPVS